MRSHLGATTTRNHPADKDWDSGLPPASVTAVLTTPFSSDSSMFQVRESQSCQGAAVTFNQLFCGPCCMDSLVPTTPPHMSSGRAGIAILAVSVAAGPHRTCHVAEPHQATSQQITQGNQREKVLLPFLLQSREVFFEGRADLVK